MKKTRTLLFTLVVLSILALTNVGLSGSVFAKNMPQTYAMENGNIIVVTNLDDAGPGTFRQAILDANANPGFDTIMFDGDYVISPNELLPVITEEVIIDGSGHTVTLDGSNYLSLNNITCPPQYTGDRSHPGLVFYQANNSKVVHMEITNWCNGITVEETDGGEWIGNLFKGNLGNAQLDFLNSNHNRTVDNVFWQIPTNPTLTSGDQIELQYSSSNYFSGNVFTGGENAYEILFESNNNVIEGEVIVSCFRGSIELRGTVHGNVIRNNIISDGVQVITEEGAVLHGFENGISLDWNSDDNVVEGNVISNIPDSGIAILTLVGFDSTNDGNVIRDNIISDVGLAGILVGAGTGNHLSGNIISTVNGIGIDLSDQAKVVPGFYNLTVSYPDGVTPNNSGLVANKGQNYPVMDEAKSKWNNNLVLLKGSLQGTDIMPDQVYDLECFGNASMVREAEVFLASKTQRADEEGIVNITMQVNISNPLGNSSKEMYVSCTATDANGNTSELSYPIHLQQNAE